MMLVVHWKGERGMTFLGNLPFTIDGVMLTVKFPNTGLKIVNLISLPLVKENDTVLHLYASTETWIGTA